MVSACASGAPSDVRAPGRTSAPSSARTSPGPVSRARTDRYRSIVATFALVGLSVPVRPLAAQAEGSWLERMGIDKLRFSALGAQVGIVKPHGIEPTTSYSVQADYGEITAGW